MLNDYHILRMKQIDYIRENSNKGDKLLSTGETMTAKEH